MATEAEVTATVLVKPEFSAQDGVKELERAIKLIKEGKVGQAEANLEHLVSLRKDLPEAYFNLGWARFQLGKHAQVLLDVQSGLRLKPRMVNGWLLLALAEREMGQFAEAEASYLAALAIDSKHAPLHWNLGVLYDLYLQKPVLALARYRAYQSLQAVPDTKVAGWIAVIERRLNRAAPAAETPPADAMPVGGPAVSSGEGS